MGERPHVALWEHGRTCARERCESIVGTSKSKTPPIYVHPFRLESVLNDLNSSEAHFIGHPVVPAGVEGEELGLREGESYCMELGYSLSLGAMQRLCPMLEFCQNNARSEN